MRQTFTPWAKLIAWARHLSSLPVIRVNQNTPAPAPDYVTIDVQGVRELGSEGGKFAKVLNAPQDTWQKAGSVTFAMTVRFQVYTKDPHLARDVAEGINLGLRNTELHADILGTDTAFNTVLNGVTDVSGLLGDQYQGRAFLDVEIHHLAPYAFSSGINNQPLGVIDTVNGEGLLAGDTTNPIPVIINATTTET